MEAYNEDFMIRQLTRDVVPESPYFKIRQELLRDGKFQKPQNTNEARLIKLYTKHHRFRKSLTMKLAKDFVNNKEGLQKKAEDSDEV